MAKQEQAARLQRDMYERGLQLGLQGLPQRDEAVSKLAQAESDRFRADAEYEIKRAALEQYAGDIPSPDLPRWREGTAPPAEDRPLEQWLGYIRDNSPEIQAARKAVDVAREDVGRLGHEMDAAEHDEFMAGPFGGDLGELERIALDIRVANDFIALVVVAQEKQSVGQPRLGPGNPLIQTFRG